MAVTVAEVDEFRGLLGEVNRIAQEDLYRLWARFNHREREVFFRALSAGVPEIVEMYRAVSSDAAALFYEETQGLVQDSSVALRSIEPNREQVERSLRWAFYGADSASALSLIGGIVQKHVVDGARDYAVDMFDMEGGAWMRSARPGACTFCRLLATRGVGDESYYTSAAAAEIVGGGGRRRSARRGRKSRDLGEAFHENCMCVPVRADFEIPSYVEQWNEDYQLAYDRVGNARDLSQILAEMRRISGHSH